MRALLENLPSGVVFADVAGRLRYANGMVAETLDIEPAGHFGRGLVETVQGLANRFLDPEETARHFADSLLDAHGGTLFDVRMRSGRIYEVSHTAMSGARGLSGHLWQFVDATVRRGLEAQVRHAERMESVGRLAGGIAHDFNNLLTAILGYVDLAAHGLPMKSVGRRHLAFATEAGEQAAFLTRQLLAFARREPAQAVTLDLNLALHRMTPMLRRLLPENIELSLRTSPGPCWIRTDTGQLDQLVMNLVLNARDAMPSGGALSVVATRAKGAAGAAPSAVLEVADTGVGMAEDVRQRIFEPFFTTKERGRGTGLGLATVYGIVQQCDGRIEVRSSPGAGTRFVVTLPIAAAPSPADEPPVSDAPPHGDERILAVEDDPIVRSLVGVMLEHLGYQVLLAANANEALELARLAPAPPDLLLADIVMPGLSGRELAARLREAHPGLRVLLMSGYAAADRSRPPGNAVFISKPFTIEALATRIRAVLGAEAASA